MKRIIQPMLRYGEADWDRDYLNWGFHDEATQLEEAESVLQMLPKSKKLRILDIACGKGIHSVYWAKHGHSVTAIDLSETFLEEGRKAAEVAGVEVDFKIGDIREMSFEAGFDAVIWIERSFFDKEVARNIYRCLLGGGNFILDMRNPEHPRSKQRYGNWRTWRKENGIFYLERHETDEESGQRCNSWIEINPETDTITEKTAVTDAKPVDIPTILRECGFTGIEQMTMSGEAFTGGPEPYWLWLVADK